MPLQIPDGAVWTIGAALAVALGLEGLRRFALWSVALAKRARGKSAVEKPRGNWWSGLLGVLVVLAIGVLGFLPATISVQALAVLMGFDRNVSAGMLPGGRIIVWTYLVFFIWVQLTYTMRLTGFWRRCRYLGLLLIVPLVAQTLWLFGFEAVLDHALISGGKLLTAAPLAHILCLGVMPFLVPAIHHRFLAPLFTWASTRPAEKWRKAVVWTGNTLFVLTLVGLFALFGYAIQSSRFARIETRPGATSSPAAIGIPHDCEGDYPVLAKELKEQGTTIVAFRITTVGTVKNVEVVHSSGSPQLDLAAVVCVTRWTYIPAAIDGTNVEAPWKAQVVWKLN